MPEDNRNNDEDRSRKNGDFKMPSRNWIVWILIFCCVIIAVLFHNQYDTQGEPITQQKFTELVAKNQIGQATIKFNPQSPFKGNHRHLISIRRKKTARKKSRTISAPRS